MKEIRCVGCLVFSLRLDAVPRFRPCLLPAVLLRVALPSPPLLDPLCLFVCHFEQLGRPPRFLSVYLTDIAAGSVS